MSGKIKLEVYSSEKVRRFKSDARKTSFDWDKLTFTPLTQEEIDEIAIPSYKIYKY